MTKKDFEAIAEVIRDYGIAEKQPEFVVDLVTTLAVSNPLFNTQLFLKACRHEK